MSIRDPLLAAERAELLRAKRPRVGLPTISKPRRPLPVLSEPRQRDRSIRPRHAVWEITLRCDQACRHCGSRAGVERPNELTTEECLDLVRQIAELGVMEVTLIGGEAYLRPDFVQIVRAIRSHGMHCTMTTGGRGLSPTLAREAAAAGLGSASVSIDGAEETHDRLRGAKGSHRDAIAAMRALREAGVRLTVNTQINRLSLVDLPSILEMLVREGAEAWQIMLTVAMGRAADEPDVLLQPYDLLDLFPLLDTLAARCEEHGVRLYPGNNLGYFGPYESRLRGTLPRGHGTSCSAGRGTLGIESDGLVKGCPSLPSEQWGGGTVRDHSLVDLWERASALRYTRDRTVEDLTGFCRTCYYADICRAGCTWTTSVLFGRPGDNPYCHHRALERDREGLRERLVRRQPAPGEPFDHGIFELIVEPVPGEKEANS
ncbi:radical SAM/SPASM domain-containing protein [Labilithrix luteola]|uniref:radical SAM/SPASM domain-containing protein n=1 Tax=Labilithrix luteola TaxID=1391654 RepID=UPI001474D73C|nr:radical SAM protein [Labilithrix luteola]